MRRNLIDMLDACGLSDALQITSCAKLFDDSRHLLHTTSVIKYPVFVDNMNYTGYKPKIKQSSLLKTYAYQIFPAELNQIAGDYLLVPLGKSVEEVVTDLVNQEKTPAKRCLYGFPHPSGANGHRKKQFDEVKQRLQRIIKDWRE